MRSLGCWVHWGLTVLHVLLALFVLVFVVLPILYFLVILMLLPFAFVHDVLVRLTPAGRANAAQRKIEKAQQREKSARAEVRQFEGFLRTRPELASRTEAEQQWRFKRYQVTGH
jgi:hypothetical protein